MKTSTSPASATEPQPGDFVQVIMRDDTPEHFRGQYGRVQNQVMPKGLLEVHFPGLRAKWELPAGALAIVTACDAPSLGGPYAALLDRVASAVNGVRRKDGRVTGTDDRLAQAAIMAVLAAGRLKPSPAPDMTVEVSVAAIVSDQVRDRIAKALRKAYDRIGEKPTGADYRTAEIALAAMPTMSRTTREVMRTALEYFEQRGLDEKYSDRLMGWIRDARTELETLLVNSGPEPADHITALTHRDADVGRDALGPEIFAASDGAPGAWTIADALLAKYKVTLTLKETT